MTTTTSIDVPRPTPETQLHLYAAWGCPFCHRVLAALTLTGLSSRVTLTWMCNVKGEAGWQIAPGDDPLFGERSLKGVYDRLEPGAGHPPAVPPVGGPVVEDAVVSELGGHYPLRVAGNERSVCRGP